MIFQHPEFESDTRLPRVVNNINPQDRCSSNINMDLRTRKMGGSGSGSGSSNYPGHPTAVTRRSVDKRKMEYHRSLSQGNARRLLTASPFSLVSLILLLCLTASLLILPLILPPLPPPPFLLLLLPILILALLMILAFMPSNARDITYTYV